ncbi:DNA-3-methyladenine glycosylase III [Marinitoga hydrogenitolerans DSM 16785]|uniref:DNA-3-methyladenine glycosylase III n=1 Tax=Marinitoga hydrogenitolerans (strain DSM 16785 / JCM 12826 / AT1271) TaxID=1122195 RepID=A0A1M4W5K7_MARH1|nr:endonuclease III domain-containing protein [Marinitoga hydrogenitolerans]SHE76383.1 DNA-3-methyladenine glycosylase III [Marinitoga hydrogenitolerans DSM 16785]
MSIDLMEIYNKLLKLYDIPEGWWPGDTKFEIMIGALLTQNTNWNNVKKSLDNIKSANLMNPEKLYIIPDERLEILIRPSGFYKVKVQYLKNLLKWFKEYKFSFEKVNVKSKNELRSELLEIKGIGKETADSILLYAFDKLSFVIDAYTKRIFSRIGLNIKNTYDEYKKYFEKNIPQDLIIYKNFHGLIVEHSKKFCKKKPICEDCKLKKLCNRNL